MVSAACKRAGVSRSTAYAERRRNEEFALAWADVEEATTERMEREAQRRAVEGVKRDVLYQGDKVGEELHYSDTLMIFLLKARRPHVYRDNVHIQHTGPDGGPIQIQAPPDAAERSRRAAALLEAAGGLGDVDGEAEPEVNGNGNGHR